MRSTSLKPDRLKELTLVVVIVLTLVAFSFVIDNYISARFFNRVALGVAITAVLAAGQAVVIITRNIDLSVGSAAGLSAFVVGDLASTHTGLPAPVVVAIAMALGAVLGSVNGALVAYGRVPSIIVTLATMAIYRTVLVSYAGGGTVTTGRLPNWIVDFPQRTLFTVRGFDVRTMLVFAIVVVLVLQVALARYRPARALYAVGSNPAAAQQAGLPERRVILAAFVVSGALAGLAGFLVLARYGTITATAGRGLELEAIAAAVVGGVSILGGSGTVVGALLGAFLIGLLSQTLIRVSFLSEFARDAALGLLVLLAVVADGLLTKRLSRPRAAPPERPASGTPDAPALAAGAGS